MSLTSVTREAIRAYLVQEGTKYINDGAKAPDKSALQPFQARLAPGPFATWRRWGEHSFSTRSGSWFQQIALLVARQYHKEAHLQRVVTGDLRNAAQAHINEIVNLMDQKEVAKRRLPDRGNDIAEVLTVQGDGGTPSSTTSDLFVLTHAGREMYFEMKTPQPNKGQCRAMKSQILLISALRKGHNAVALAACAYNPFGEGSDFAAKSKGFVRQFLDVGNDLLVGRAFWSTIGTDTTYDELLEIAEVVGKELNPLFLQLLSDVS